MNEQWLDDLTRTIAGSLSRRRLARGLLIGLTGSMFTRRASRARIACGVVGATCGTNGDCCPFSVCSAKRCACRADYAACNRRCVHLSYDARNCGRCGNECDPHEICVAGVCRPGAIQGHLEPEAEPDPADGDIDLDDTPPQAG